MLIACRFICGMKVCSCMCVSTQLYFQDHSTDEYVPVDLHSTLRSILALSRYEMCM